MRVPPYQCPQTGSPFAHHCILSSRSMSEYGLFRSRGFCAFFFLGIGMKPRLISLFLSRLCRADLAISSSFQLKYPAGAVGTPSLRGERQQGYCPIMAGVRVRGNSTPSAAGVFLETGTTGLSCRILRNGCTARHALPVERH